jgi:hypothetical protein
LERKVWLHAPDVKLDPNRSPQAWLNVFVEAQEQEALLRDKGSDYDKAVLDLYIDVARPRSVKGRPLTLEQFQEFRAGLEGLSPKEIAKEKSLLQEMQQISEDAHDFLF